MVTDKLLLGVLGVGTLLLSGCVALEVTKIKKLNDIQKEIEYFEWEKGVYYNRKDNAKRTKAWFEEERKKNCKESDDGDFIKGVEG